MKYRIYMDVCCLNRPFDERTQDRVRLEAEAVLSILSKGRSGDWIASSNALDAEIAQTPNLTKMAHLQAMLALATIKIRLSNELAARARQLAQLGFGADDAAHLASASKSMESFPDSLLSKHEIPNLYGYLLPESPV